MVMIGFLVVDRMAEYGLHVIFFFFKQKTAYEMRISDWSSDVCSSDLMMSDPRMEAMGADMPFDGKRMIIGGFTSIVDDRSEGETGYVDGYVVPVPEGNKEAYRALAQKASEVFRDYGATRVVEAWSDDVPDGKVTDYARAAHKKDGETVVYSWVEWPDKETRAKGWEKMMTDERMKHDPATNPFDGARMIYGGFAPIVMA